MSLGQFDWLRLICCYMAAVGMVTAGDVDQKSRLNWAPAMIHVPGCGMQP